MKKMMFLSQNWYFSVQKALIYYTFNKSHHNSFILLVFSHVANFRYVANFTFLLLIKKLFLANLYKKELVHNAPFTQKAVIPRLEVFLSDGTALQVAPFCPSCSHYRWTAID